ncbi:MAG: L,D-transpeptidase family protein [Phycisphaerae bacterium]|nr:L,D-transpeptidase family protein [Phycisphaerae bacterium]
MAISSYGNYRPNRKNTIIYYIAAAVIAALATAIFLYNPFKKTQPQQPTEAPVQTPVKKDQAGPQAKTGFGGIAAEANSLAGPRVAAILQDAQKNIAEGRTVAARDILNDVLNMAMEDSLRQQVKKQMEGLANDWLFGRTVQLGDNLCSTYKIQPGDVLANVAVNFKVPYQLLMRINNISSDKALQAGQTIKVVHGPFHAVVYRSSFTMDLYLQNMYVKSYKVGLGKVGHETPLGLWRAKPGGKLVKPTWTDPETGKVYHADDPDYPLGSGWIALEGTDSRTRGIEGIAIHGTNDESTIGTKSSRGCIRLFNGELKEVYDIFEPGFSELRVAD